MENGSFRLYKWGVTIVVYLFYYPLWFFLFKVFFIEWLLELNQNDENNYNLFILSIILGIVWSYNLMKQLKDMVVVFSYIYLGDDSPLTTDQLDWKEFLEGTSDEDYDE